MSIKNKISESIKQQFTQYYDNYLAYAIHQWAANEVSDSIALCIIGCGDCKVRYQGIANSFNITEEEIKQDNIVSIKNKIENEAKKEDSKFSELISKFDQSLKEQSKMSVIKILSSSAEEMLKSFFEPFHSTTQKDNLPTSISGEEKSDGSNADQGSSYKNENVITLPIVPEEENVVVDNNIFPM